MIFASSYKSRFTSLKRFNHIKCFLTKKLVFNKLYKSDKSNSKGECCMKTELIKRILPHPTRPYISHISLPLNRLRMQTVLEFAGATRHVCDRGTLCSGFDASQGKGTWVDGVWCLRRHLSVQCGRRSCERRRRGASWMRSEVRFDLALEQPQDITGAEMGE